MKSSLMYFIDDKKEEYKKKYPSKDKKEVIYELTKMYWDMDNKKDKKIYKDLEVNNHK